MPTSIVNTNTLSNHKTYLIKLFISVGLFIFSGLASSYLYYQFPESGGSFFPGLLYTSSTILIFLLTKKTTKTKELLIYYILMNLTYLVIWLLTMLSSWLVLLGGILTAGTGAIITFILVDKFVVNIKFSKANLFMIGGLAFLITDILYFTFGNIYDKTPLEYIFRVATSPNTLFVEVFIFWHTLVGTKLFLTLQK
jgi:hypothetical protein